MRNDGAPDRGLLAAPLENTRFTTSIERERHMRQLTQPRPSLRIVHRPGFGAEPGPYQENAATYMSLAERVEDQKLIEQYTHLGEAWLSLAETNAWLEGRIPPLD